MSNPTFSPDGKWMWDGDEWIPAPPESSILSQSSVDEQAVSIVAEQSGLDSQQLSQTASYFDSNQDGVLQQSEIQQAVLAMNQSPNMPYPAQSPQQQIVYVQQTPMMNAKSSGVAILLAFLWPGLDYFYLENGGSGVIRAIGCAFLVITLIGIPVALIIWILGIASSSKRTAEYNLNLAARMQ
ncbi:hypothetical protein N9L38_05710 [Candidatus Poseidoniales archaeon]|nr:hypothetical protein [Candidatus Poseidoniales archaeon]